MDDLPPAYHTLTFTSLPPGNMVRSNSSNAPPAYDSLSLELVDPPIGLPPPAYRMVDMDNNTTNQSTDTEQSTVLVAESNTESDTALNSDDPWVHSGVHCQHRPSGDTN